MCSPRQGGVDFGPSRDASFSLPGAAHLLTATDGRARELASAHVVPAARRPRGAPSAASSRDPPRGRHRDRGGPHGRARGRPCAATCPVAFAAGGEVAVARFGAGRSRSPTSTTAGSWTARAPMTPRRGRACRGPEGRRRQGAFLGFWRTCGSAQLLVQAGLPAGAHQAEPLYSPWEPFVIRGWLGRPAPLCGCSRSGVLVGGTFRTYRCEAKGPLTSAPRQRAGTPIVARRQRRYLGVRVRPHLPRCEGVAARRSTARNRVGTRPAVPGLRARQTRGHGCACQTPPPTSRCVGAEVHCGAEQVVDDGSQTRGHCVLPGEHRLYAAALLPPVSPCVPASRPAQGLRARR